MKRLLIVGAGGHGQVVAEIAADLGYDQIDFLDDNSSLAIGTLKEMRKFTSYQEAFCGIGANQLRKEVIQNLIGAGYKIPKLVHPTAYVSRTATVEMGCVIEPHAIVNAYAQVGPGSIVSVGAIVDHNASIGSYCHVNSGSIVKAGASLEDFTKLEAGEIVLGYPSSIVRRQEEIQ